MAPYGAQKVAKTTLALGKPKLLTGVHHSYKIGLLRCFPAFSLFVSFIRDQKAVPATARGPSGRLPPDGPAPGTATSAFPTS